MMDWGYVGAHTLWILGCALGLAIFSYISWQASVDGVRLGSQLRRRETQIGFDVAGLLFCCGLALSITSMLRSALGAILGASFLAHMLYTIFRSKPTQTP